jgi:hypothetical protein
VAGVDRDDATDEDQGVTRPRLPPLKAGTSEKTATTTPTPAPPGSGQATLPPLRQPEQQVVPQAPAPSPKQKDKPPVPDETEPPDPGRRAFRSVAWILLPLVVLGAIVAGIVAGASGSHGRTFLSLAFGHRGDTGIYRSQRVMRGFIQSRSGEQSPFELTATEMESFQVDASRGNSTRLVIGSSEWGFFNGQPLQSLQGKLAVDTPVVIGSGGEITSGGKIPLPGPAGHTGAMPGTDLFLPVLPDRPVSRGDIWTGDYRRPFIVPGGGTMEYQTHNKLVRFESVGGHRAAVISTQARVPIDVTLAMSRMRAANPSLADQIIKAFNLTPRSAFHYRGLVTYRLRSTVDTVTHRLMRTQVNGEVRVRVAETGGQSPDVIQIVSSLNQSGRLVS